MVDPGAGDAGARLETMQHRSERVLIETDRYRIFGSLTLPRDGYRSRMSDFLNSSDRDFISLTDVVMEAVGGDGSRSNHEYIAVARSHIVFAMPVAEADAEAEAEAEAPERPEHPQPPV
jgi:Family of unknown function (DUF6812)